MPIDFPTFLSRLPKVELHCHLVGAIRPATLVALAAKHRLPLPRAESELYRYTGFHDFIAVFRLAARVLVDAEDFERVTYEYIADAHRDCNLQHLELFFDPSYHYPFGVRYRTQLDGILAGVRAARRDFGVSALLIPSIDREFGPVVGAQVIDDVLADRRDEVVGIGMDGPEDKGPPELYADCYVRAAGAGLKRTAHVCEDYAPTSAGNYAICRDVLGCDRLDHGYRLLTDAAIAARAKNEGVALTCCPKPSTRERDASRLDAIRQLEALGIPVTLATDDPRMFETDLSDCYRRYFSPGHDDLASIRRTMLAGVEAAWLADAERRALRQSFETQFDALANQLVTPFGRNQS